MNFQEPGGLLILHQLVLMAHPFLGNNTCIGTCLDLFSAWDPCTSLLPLSTAVSWKPRDVRVRVMISVRVFNNGDVRVSKQFRLPSKRHYLESWLDVRSLWMLGLTDNYKESTLITLNLLLNNIGLTECKTSIPALCSIFLWFWPKN